MSVFTRLRATILTRAHFPELVKSIIPAIRLRRYAALLGTLAAFMLPMSESYADEKIVRGSIAYGNILKAIDFVRSMGDTEIADQLTAQLNSGGYYFSTTMPSTKAAETGSVTLNVTLNNITVSPSVSLDPQTGFEGFLNLAATLVHENVHVQQGRPLIQQGLATLTFYVGTVLGQRVPEREPEAWTKEIEALDRWADHLYYLWKSDAKFKQKNFERLKFVVERKIHTIDGYVNGDDFWCAYQNFFMKNPWADVKVTMQQLLTQLNAVNPKEVGLLLKKADTEEQYALMQPACQSCSTDGTLTATLTPNIVTLNSTTTFKTSIDTYKVKNDPVQAQLNGRANFGSWFASGQVSFGGDAGGSFGDVFPATPAANFSGTISSGSIYNVIADAGYNFIQGPGLRVGAFGGYYSLSENLSGMTAGATATFPVLADRWQAMRAGIAVEKDFIHSGVPVMLKLDVAGLPLVNLKSGAFNNNGSGVQSDVTLFFPIPNTPLVGDIFFQDTYMNVSGNTAGVHMTVTNTNWTIGGGITLPIGESPPVPKAILTK